MFALMNAEDTRFHFPEFADDYEILWDIYTGKNIPEYTFDEGVGNWNNLVSLLSEYEKRQKPLATIFLDKKTDPTLQKMVYVLPEYAYKAVQAIIGKLINMQAISERSNVCGYTSENCKVEIIANGCYEGAFNSVFARPEILHSFYGMNVIMDQHDGEDRIRFVYTSMEVKDLDLEADGKNNGKYYYDILDRLEKQHFIRNLTRSQEHPWIVSFEYISARIKKLLTSVREILKIYTYYQLLNTGYFDDVACGYEFRWQEGGVKNELDIVAVKGFCSVIAECKAVQKLELDYYHKLHSIAEHFGIGTRKVLIGNLYSYKADDILLGKVNQMQQSRGKQLGIVTVSDEEGIVKIGQTLKNLM
jgi:hypothetical protein